MADGSGAAYGLWLRPEPAAFRNGLAKLASGVAIVACWAEGQPQGLLVSSLTGLSTEPPRLLFCVRKAAGAHAALLATEAVGLSLLPADDHQEARRFASPELAGQRFATERWRLDPAQPPLLAHALATFSGRVCSRIDAGSHTIFIVDAATAEVSPAKPLLYFDRDFRNLA